MAREIFQECDVDVDGRLRAMELYFFAVETGFKGGPELWTQEYGFLCEERGLDPAAGLPQAAFTAMLDDRSEAGCFCTDEELGEVLSRLRQTRPWRTTAELAARNDLPASHQQQVSEEIDIVYQ